MLSTEDLTRAVAFYGELLGGAETYRFPEKGRRSSSRSGSKTRKSGLRLLAPAFRSTVSGCVPRRAVELCIYVDDVAGTIERVRESGMSILLEPVDQPWAERVAYVQDPDGNR